MPNSLCRTFANTLGGTADVVNGVCTVTRIRSNLRPLIQGRRTNSVLAIAALFSFEDLDNQGNALNLGETVLLQEEVNPFISQLRTRGIEVTALHNRWLFDNPRLMYIHFKSVEPPLAFAQKVAAAFRVLTTRTVSPNRTSGSTGSNGSRGLQGTSGYTPPLSDQTYGYTMSPNASCKTRKPSTKGKTNSSIKAKSTVKSTATKTGKPSQRTSTKRTKRSRSI
ncbi:DUF1259 domain-containing protein [Paenibacillus oenotherae]|uniref:DUF1259 domain-containing protein n=2 Tax=Paenibacillus oenotherae TaxID=1435645 RepID=A0ABS7D5U3_9BACL|nr:DUF1259 domain-containing protein [Paenibacillus oenotherae]